MANIMRIGGGYSAIAEIWVSDSYNDSGSNASTNGYFLLKRRTYKHGNIHEFFGGGYDL